jgi:hypothetical protein
MSLLTVCKDAADEIGLLQPTTIASGLDTTSRKLFRMAKKVGKDLMQFHAWEALRTETTFTASAGSEQDVLPSDFDRFVPETFWNRSEQYLLAGPISPVEWNGLKAQNSSGDAYKFIIRGGKVYTYPNAPGGDTYAFEYVSANYADVEATGTPKAAFTLDSDVFRMDDELLTLGIVFEYLQADGLDAGAAFAAYEKRRTRLIKNERAKAGVMTSGDIFATNTRHHTGEPSIAGQSLF